MSAPAPTAAQLSLPIEGMSCASCVGRVERALAAVPGVAEANVSLASGRAAVRLAAPVERAALVRAGEGPGYAVPEPTVELSIEGMSCASCVGRIERALSAVPGVTVARMNIATERATVTGTAKAAALIAAVEAAGYAARTRREAGGGAAEAAAAERREAETRALRRDLTLAAALTLPVFALEMGSHLARRCTTRSRDGRDASELADPVCADDARPRLPRPALLRPGPARAPARRAGHEQPRRRRHAGGLPLLAGRDLRPGAAASGDRERILRGGRGHRNPDPARPLPGGAREGADL